MWTDLPKRPGHLALSIYVPLSQYEIILLAVFFLGVATRVYHGVIGLDWT